MSNLGEWIEEKAIEKTIEKTPIQRPRCIGVLYFFMSIELIHLLFAAIYFTNTFFRCQISLTYSSMVLSEENLPEHAVLRMAILFQALLSL